MSSEQPKLNNSEVNNNSTSGESETAPQQNAMLLNQHQQHTQPNLKMPTNHAPAATSTLDNSSISSNRNKRHSKKAKSFAAPSWA